MERKEFIKTACTLGICSCAGMSLLTSGTILAEGNSIPGQDPDWRIGFMQKRFANLIKVLDSIVDPAEKKRILEEMGRGCANQGYEQFSKFTGNPEGLLELIKSEWAESTEYNKEKNTIKIVGRKMDACFCPFVDPTFMSKDFCNCTLGYNKHMFETILGKSVEVTIEESVLRGGERCTFVITAGQ